MALNQLITGNGNTYLSLIYNLDTLVDTTHDFGSNNNRNAVATNYTGTWVAVGYTNAGGGVGQISYSTDDGSTWSSGAPLFGSFPDVFHCVMWDGTRFLAASSDGFPVVTNSIWQSTNSGASWTKIVDFATDADTPRGIVWDGNQYILSAKVGTSGSSRGQLYTSPDGTIWTSALVADSGGFFRYFDMPPVTNGDITLVCDSFSCYSSTDGCDTFTITDLRTPFGFNPYIFSVIWDGTNFVGVGYDFDSTEDYTFVSPDGVAWTAYDAGTSGSQFSDVKWDGVNYWILGSDSLFTSSDMAVAPSVVLTADYGSYFGINPEPEILLITPDVTPPSSTTNPAPLGIGSIPM